MLPPRHLLPVVLVLTAACAQHVGPETATVPHTASPTADELEASTDVFVSEADMDATIEVPANALVFIELENDLEGFEWELWASTVSIGEPQLDSVDGDKVVYLFDTTAIPVGREHLHVFGYADPTCAHYECTDRTFSFRTKIVDAN